MSFSYLWINRAKPALLGKPWGKYWVKRLVTFPALVKLTWCRNALRLSGATIGPLTVLGACVISGSKRRLHIGERSVLGQVTIALHHNVFIGSRAVVNDGVTLLTASHDLSDPQWRAIAKPIYIEDYAWIAQGATILPGVRIGKGAVVGAGAVVSRDIPDFSIAVGNPARILEKRRVIDLDYNPVDLVAAFEAWLGRNIVNVNSASEQVSDMTHT